MTAETTAEETLLDRLDAAEDLAPTVGSGRKPVPLTIGGKEYRGIASVPLEELALCSREDYLAMRPSHRSHRSRRLQRAAKDGTFTPDQVSALQSKGVLPSGL